ncbi:MAG: RdgB/HAM1 family non-canonical purine NTP pyrophosphatase [Bacteroidia bacterium]
MQTLLFGTNNRDKLREIREVLHGRFTVLGLADLGLDLDVEETEDTLVGNALLKARAYQAAAGMPCFADDSGLEVDALGGAPGVYSARWAGPGCSYADNVARLLREMQGQSLRTARFRAVIAYTDGTTTRTFDGVVEGRIIDAVRGAGGFGYDPVFVPEGYDQTFAEMNPGDKHAISHRGRAVRAFVQALQADFR